MNPSKANNRVKIMTSRKEFEALAAEFKAKRNTMSQADCEAMRLKVNAMFHAIQTEECIALFESGQSIDVQVFLSLLKHYNIEYTNSFNEWVQKDIVVVSKTGYDSYKISKVKAKELLSYVAQLIEAVDMPKLIEQVIAANASTQQTEEEVEDMSSLTNTLDQNEMNAQAKVIRREGTITDRSDIEDERGCVTSLWIEHRGRNWWIMMVNGEVCHLKQNGL